MQKMGKHPQGQHLGVSRDQEQMVGLTMSMGDVLWKLAATPASSVEVAADAAVAKREMRVTASMFKKSVC